MRAAEPSKDSGHGAAVSNQVSGTVAGSVVQAGVIHGGVHVHEAAPLRAVPYQLPGAAREFVNRTHQLAAMTRRLIPRAHGPGIAVISVIDGTAGIGKTALALHWAHNVREHFPDGQLYVNLRGFDPAGIPLASAEALQLLLEGLGVSPDQVPTSADSRAALYRSLLSGRRVLVVLDNAAETTQVEVLLPGGALCATLVTSRNRLDGLTVRHRADRIALDVFTSSHSTELMAKHLGPDRLAAEPHAVTELILRCGHLPLALSIIAARASSYPDFPLHLLAEELRDQCSRLDALDTGDLTTNIRAVFSWSYRQLPVATARVFRLLGLHPGPDIGLPAAAGLVAMSEQRTRQHLGVLARANLLEQHMPNRFRFHDLLRTYAAEQADEDEPSLARRLALCRVLDSYLHTTHNASRQLNAHRLRIPIDPAQPDAIIRKFDTYDDAMKWYQEEYQNLMVAIEWSATHDFDEYAWRLALTFWQYLYLCGRWHEVISTHETALSSAGRVGDLEAVAAVHINLGVSRAQLGDYNAGATDFREALALYRRAADLDGQGNALDSLAWVHAQAGDFREAIAHGEQALRIYRQIGDLDGEARTLDSLGVAHAGLDQPEQGIGYGSQALELHRQTANRIGQAHALRSIGRCYAQTGDYRRAVTQFQQALELCREIGDRHDEASNLRDLGTSLHLAGDDDEARKHLEQALAILTELRHPSATAIQVELAALRPSSGPTN